MLGWPLKFSIRIGILLLICIVLFATDLFLGSLQIPFNEVVNVLFTGKSSHPEWTLIVADFRLPKALAASIAGIALSVAGLQMQTVFRNPLAGPDVLGISSGAGLGVAFLILSFPGFLLLSTTLYAGYWLTVVAACIGAALSLFLILAITVRVRDIMTVLIVGMMIGAAISSVVSILQFFGNAEMLKSFVIWTMGSIGHIGLSQLQVMFPAVAFGILLAFICVKRLDALLLGEKYAITMGLHIKTTRNLVFLSTSILAGTITAFCGPIAFIAVAVPHISRYIFKTNQHKTLLVASMLLGAIALLLCDIISQLPGSNLTIPINAVSALIGIPVIISIVLNDKKKNLV